MNVKHNNISSVCFWLNKPNSNSLVTTAKQSPTHFRKAATRGLVMWGLFAELLAELPYITNGKMSVVARETIKHFLI